MADASSDIAILAENVTVRYRHSEYRYSSLKEYIMQRLKGRIEKKTIQALDNVNITIKKGESIALVGHNGSGKSTLLRVFAGVIEPPKARIQVNGRVAPMIELSTGFDGELSGYENIILSCSLMGLTSAEIKDRIEDIISFAELRPYIDMPFKNYSSGMQARLGFSCVTAVEPDILLVDEVLAVGDSNFAKKCLQRIETLRAGGTTVVLVSHDTSVIKSFCSRAYVLDMGKMVFEGSVEDAIALHEEIMENRYLANLSDETKKEQQRAEASASQASKRFQLPKIKVKFLPKQNNLSSRPIDLAKPFTLSFKLSIEEPELFNDQIIAGLALNTVDGQRVSGANNKHLEIDLSSTLRKGGHVDIDFNFAKGIRHLCAGVYKVVFLIHDNNLARSICCQEVGYIEASNSALTMNSDHDICNISEVLTDIKVNQTERTTGTVDRNTTNVSKEALS